MRISINGSTRWPANPVWLVDALTMLAAIAPVAPDIELGTAVNATYPIQPTALYRAKSRGRTRVAVD